MSYEVPGFSFTLVAGEALAQYRFVKVHTDGTAMYADNGEFAIGVVQNTPVAAEAATVMHSGISMVETGTGGLTPGASVAADADGKAIVAATADLIVGVCLTTSAATKYAAVLLTPKPAASA